MALVKLYCPNCGQHHEADEISRKQNCLARAKSQWTPRLVPLK
jgi:predicted RNA-binding Zn-ribbon protein involved in translation (DUF1610 family)